MAGRKVLELEPDDDAAYVLLWNLYRSKNQSEDALRAVKMMRDQRITKAPGSSWIQRDGTVHEFLFESSIYPPLSADMIVVLDRLIQQSKLEPVIFAT